MRGMTTLPKVTRSYQWSETKLEDPNESMECDIIPFSALRLLLGRQEGHKKPVKKLDVVVMI